MLRFLSIRNLAVIDRIDVELEPGLSILTGETGAGKSVIVEAIELLTGGRASADLVRTGEDLATVQAVFELPDRREVIVRREISSQGRSRAFIDDALATSAALRELGMRLVDFHGQHDQQALLDPQEHRAHLDEFAGTGELVAACAAAFDTWQAATSALERTKLDDREKQARVEMASFQLEEIRKVRPQADEDASLEAERVVLSNADRLRRLSSEAYTALYDGETAALASLSTVWKRTAELADLDARFAPYLDQRANVKAALEDLAFFLRGYANELDASPDRLQAVEDRLTALERLKRRYGPTLADVLAKERELQDELTALGASEERISELERSERGSRAAYAAAAQALSAARKQGAGVLARRLEEALAELAMPNSRVEVRLTSRSSPEAWTRSGFDEVELYLSANPGEEPKPLAKIASGGELSRIKLALRTLATTPGTARTLIFDEVDAGIGGEAADAVGARLQALARDYQLLCITHLPQIAARAHTHFHVAKHVARGRTGARLTRLDAGGRELELARMIAGASVSSRVIASARELLATRGESETKPKGESDRTSKAKGRRHGS